MISDAVAYGNAALGTAINDAQNTRKLLDTLSAQTAGGKVADTYGGLSRYAAATSLSLQPQVAQQQAVTGAINAVTGRMSVAQNALSQISSIASNFFAQTNNLNNLNSSEVANIASDARDALAEVAGLVDATDGNVYVFSGQDTSNPPIADPQDIYSSAFGNAISSAVSSLSTNGATATIASTLSIAGTGSGAVSPFSAAINDGSATAPTVSLGDGQFVQVGLVAGTNSEAVSGGSSTTGSYLRDILRGLATIGSMTTSQAVNDSADFNALVSDTQSSLGGAITALNQDAGVLGDRQAELTQTSTTLAATTTALKTQISNVQDVDMTSTISQLTQVQTQLSASYQVIVALQSSSLTKFLA